jgi:serine/threonine protein kinase
MDQQTKLQEELDSEFKIVRLLGEGPVAQVYLARENALQRLVAIKLMKPALAADDTARKRFEREGRSAAKIHHHNVATVHRVGTLKDETPFIIMEYIEGRNLADVLKAEGAMTVEQARGTLSQVASALAAAHENGIVHRDVKPDNVVRERDSDRVVLTDFGIAAILESGGETITRLTQQGQLLGDPRYMSPEQLLGEDVTEESDVYSLGIMGYELLTLKAPYEGTTSVQMATAHLKREPISLARVRPDADPSLAELLERCLSKNPLHRPRASEVAKALEQDESRGDSGPYADQRTAVPVPQSAFEGFILELRRRRVINVAILYFIIAVPLLAYAADIIEYLPMIPGDVETQMSILIALIVASFPVVLVFSWMFDISAKGIQRTESALSGAALAKLHLMQSVGLVVSLVLAGVVSVWLWP